MLTSRRFKSTFLIVLAVLLIGAVGAYALETTWGYNDDVYWDVTVGNLYRSGDYTYSYHQFYVENDSDGDVDLTYEFAHRVIQTFTDGRADLVKITKKQPPEGTSDIVTVTRWGLNNDSSALKEKTHSADISGLPPGMFYIDAYTRINLHGIAEDPVPEVRMNTKANPFEIF